MKRIVSFFILLSLLIVILSLPAAPVTPAAPHPIPIWSILCYLAVVGIAALAVARLIRQENGESKPERAKARSLIPREF